MTDDKAIALFSCEVGGAPLTTDSSSPLVTPKTPKGKPGKGKRKHRGGYRIKRRTEPQAAAVKRRSTRRVPLDPLDYILGVIGDENATPARRDRLAIVALPYKHVKVGEPGRVLPLGKKQIAQRNADRAIAGDANGDWGDDLRIDD